MELKNVIISNYAGPNDWDYAKKRKWVYFKAGDTYYGVFHYCEKRTGYLTSFLDNDIPYCRVCGEESEFSLKAIKIHVKLLLFEGGTLDESLY